MKFSLVDVVVLSHIIITECVFNDEQPPVDRPEALERSRRSVAILSSGLYRVSVCVLLSRLRKTCNDKYFYCVCAKRCVVILTVLSVLKYFALVP